MKSDGRECELVIFDCDGVLVDSEILSARAYAELFADLGVPLPLGVMEGCFGLKQADIFARIEAAVGRVIGPDDRAQLWPRTRALFASELKPTPGLVPFLQRLRLAHCVVSSSHEERIRFQPRNNRPAGLFRRRDLQLPTGRARKAGAGHFPARSRGDGRAPGTVRRRRRFRSPASRERSRRE